MKHKGSNLAKDLKAWFVTDNVEVIYPYSVSVHCAGASAGVRWSTWLQNFMQVVETGSVKFALIFAKQSPKTLRVLRSERDITDTINLICSAHGHDTFRMFGLLTTLLFIFFNFIIIFAFSILAYSKFDKCTLNLLELLQYIPWFCSKWNTCILITAQYSKCCIYWDSPNLAESLKWSRPHHHVLASAGSANEWHIRPMRHLSQNTLERMV